MQTSLAELLLNGCILFEAVEQGVEPSTYQELSQIKLNL